MTPKRRIIPVFVPNLGCPHMCVFCNQHTISGQEHMPDGYETAKIIAEGLGKLHGEKAVVAFYGGSFTAIPADKQIELLSAVQPFIAMGAVESIRLSTRPDAIDPEILARLKKFGVRTIELGVQSMDEDVLRLSGRGHTAADASFAAEMVKDAGFKLILQMMTGLPGDTPEKSIHTAEMFCRLHPDGVRVYPTVIIRDTEMYRMWKRGEYKEHTVEDAVALCADIADIFDEAGIPVIRLGLNPTDDLSGGEAVGGAYHPALGELVRGRRYLKRQRILIKEPAESVTFAVAKGETSAATGQKRCNIEVLCREFNLKSVKIVEDPVLTGMEIKIVNPSDKK